MGDRAIGRHRHQDHEGRHRRQRRTQLEWARRAVPVAGLLAVLTAIPAASPAPATSARQEPPPEEPPRRPATYAAAPHRDAPPPRPALPQQLPRAADPLRGVHAAGGAVALALMAKAVPPAPEPAPVPSAAPPAGPPPSAPTDGTAGARIIADARLYLGVPYVYDGATPAGFDCSGYTMWVYAQAGVANLPHNSEAQRQVFREIRRAEALPGDLIFYMSGGTSYHVAIYAGGDMQYAAPAPGQDVKLEPIWSSEIVFGTDWH